jgi:AcrR family transcriptional regulator
MDFAEIAEKIDRFLNPEADSKQARKRELILNAATELFIAYGYRKTTIDDVAGAAGVAKGTVYLYYKNKAELLLHAITLQKQRYLNELEPVVDPSIPARDRLKSLIRLSIAMSRDLPLINRFTGGDHEIEQVLADVDSSTLRHVNELQVEFAAHLIDEASGHSLGRDVLEMRAQVLIDLVFAAVNGGRMIRSGTPPEDYALVLADVIVEGLVSREGLS